jgi:hypothetical protein
MPHHSDQVRAELAAAVRDGASITAVASAHSTTHKAVRHAYCTLTATGGVANTHTFMVGWPSASDGVNVYAGMTAQGVTACHFVTGTSK